MLKRMFAILALLTLVASMTVSAQLRRARDVQSYGFNERIRKELVTLPYYGVFDNLAYQVNGNTVVLYGQVVRPSTRTDAERRVSRIEGVERVVNNIQVLPLSPFDDSIRRRVYQAVF